jgi:exopolyphosphatase / guanosine-5'-triphosphate,3'-diphosphate pyrophosphatase
VRIAALDLGSNSFHMIVVEARLDGTFLPLVREKETLRLGDRVAKTGALGEPAKTEALEVIKRFLQVAQADRADEVIALGTAAIREASDGAEFVERVNAETGIEIKVVDGTREAELIFTAVRSSVLIDPGPALAADLGGGSLELIVGDRTEIAYSASAPIGVGRLTAAIENDPLKDSDLRRLRRIVAEALDPVIDEIVARGPKQFIVSSGTFLALVRMAAAREDGTVHEIVNQLTVERDAVEELTEEVFKLRAAERAKLAGSDPRRAEQLPAGAVVLEYLLNETGLGEVTASEWALREGIVLDAIGAHDPVELLGDPRALRRWSVLSLCRRSNWRQPHARQVAMLATQLFDATRFLHTRGSRERELLEFAAYLHDIGEHISRQGHDRHTAYLIENGGLRGFSPSEIRILSSIGRFHIRGTPKPSFEAFAELSEDDAARAVELIAILRLADALDASHRGIVSAIDVSSLGPGRTLRIEVQTSVDAGLELWSSRRKQELFERIFGVDLAVTSAAAPAATYREEGASGSGFG